MAPSQGCHRAAGRAFAKSLNPLGLSFPVYKREERLSSFPPPLGAFGKVETDFTIPSLLFP